MEGKIEDYAHNHVIVDFANKRIGGEILTRGAAQ
jgi:hypothetical protein